VGIVACNSRNFTGAKNLVFTGTIQADKITTTTCLNPLHLAVFRTWCRRATSVLRQCLLHANIRLPVPIDWYFGFTDTCTVCQSSSVTPVKPKIVSKCNTADIMTHCASAPCRLQGVSAPWFICLFWRYINCLFVYLTCFFTFFFPYTFFLV